MSRVQLPSTPMPIDMPLKAGQVYLHNAHAMHAAYGQLSVSPPEGPESISSSNLASYDPSTISSSGYRSTVAGSSALSESEGGPVGGSGPVDLLDYMSHRLQAAVDPLPLDRSLARQAQT